MTMTLAAIAFLFVLLVIAFIAFKMLKKTVKMALRVAIAAIIVAVAVAGSAFFLLTGKSKTTSPPKPVSTR